MIITHELFGDYQILVTQEGFTVQKRHIFGEDSKKSGEESWNAVSYPSRISNAVKYILHQLDYESSEVVDLTSYLNRREEKFNSIIRSINGAQ